MQAQYEQNQYSEPQYEQPVYAPVVNQAVTPVQQQNSQPKPAFHDDEDDVGELLPL